ncbi:hypothetical protein FACS1894170_07400 [Planctomycetales bacterium]|nr:hypothetical protein FACS1894170_07400 [Planctomycetales bacterium]
MTKDEFEIILNDLTAAKDNLNRLNLELQRVRSKLYLEIKRSPAKYGLDKATEEAIKAVITVNAEVIELEGKILEAKHWQGICFERYDLAKFELAKEGEE